MKIAKEKKKKMAEEDEALKLISVNMVECLWAHHSAYEWLSVR